MVVAWAARAAEAVPLEGVVRTFVVGVATGRTDLLSCLGSWSNLRHMRLHHSESWGTFGFLGQEPDDQTDGRTDLPQVFGSLGCRVCGFGDILSRDLDLRSLEVERLGGGYRAGSIVYWLYDTFRVVEDGVPRMRSGDMGALRRLLDDLDQCSRRRGATFKRSDALREVRASHKQSGLDLKQPAAVRLLNSLGASGVLCPRALKAPFDGHIPMEVRIQSTRGSQLTYEYPFTQWTGADGVDFERFEELMTAARSTETRPDKEER